MLRKSKSYPVSAMGLVCLGLIVSSAGAQELASEAGDEETSSIVTDRPDFTESAETVPQGRTQVEGGYTFTRTGRDGEHSFGEMLVRVATGTRSEVRIGLPSYTHRRGPSGAASGWSDALLGAKFGLSKGGDGTESRNPKTALLIGTTLPTGSSAFRERKLQPEAILAASIDLSEKTALASNVGYSHASDGGTRFAQVFGSISLAHSLTERIGAYAELYGFTKINAQGDSARYFNSGLTYLINNDLQLDARAGIGINNDIIGSDYFLGAGIARRF